MIKLRPMTIDDIEFVITVRNLSREMLHDNREFTFAQGREWFTRTDPPFFIIESDGVAVGYIRTSNWDEDNMNVCIGADIHPAHRRKGYAKAAYKLMLETLFNFGMHKVYLEVLSTNKIAASLYQQLGFVVEGVKRQHLLRNNEYVDSIMMSILKEEWQHAGKII